MTRIKGKIEKWVKETLELEGLVLVHPKELENGDYTLIINGSDAEANFEKLKATKIAEIEAIEFAPPRFINLLLSKQFFAESIKEINDQGEQFGETKLLAGQKIVIEHTQPNPFKEFHIGHLMNNAVGESVARILKANNADVKTCSYHGDVGLHVAKAILGVTSFQDKFVPPSEAPISDKVTFWGKAYAAGSNMYESSDEMRRVATDINKKIYTKEDQDINQLYDLGRETSLEYFESTYKKLDSHFDKHFFESESGEIGQKLVKENIGKIFEESEGAVVFRGENFEPKTHTRVFLNKDGLPTYEAKELGLAKLKISSFGNYVQSITVTANEQDSFFKVVEVAIGEIFAELKGKLKHLSHGMLRLPTGKMSSRTGDVITAGSLIQQIQDRVLEKMHQNGRIPEVIDGEEAVKIAEQVGIGAIKYSILRQAIGGDIVFDFEKSISFEGDSGPYLQYTAVRAKSVLEKANLTPSPSPRLGEGGEEVLQNWDLSREALAKWEPTEVERMLYRFPEIVERAGQEYAPHHLVTYLTELASAFNSFYGNNKIISEEDPTSSYKVALTESVYHVLKNGLHLLGIKVPERM